MDSLIAGYGLSNQNNNANNPPPGYQSSAIVPVSNSNSNQAKKQLTLSEKQELAARLDNEQPVNGHKEMHGSMSLSSIKSTPATKSNDLSDSLFDRNLADLNISSKPTGNNTSNFNMLSQQMTSPAAPFHQAQAMNKPPMTMMNNNFGSSFNQIRPQTNNNNNSQLGFFGNLALPAPSSNQPAPSLNALKTSNSPMIPAPSLIPPPPKANVPSIGNAAPSQSTKKTALDDLADIFG